LSTFNFLASEIATNYLSKNSNFFPILFFKPTTPLVNTFGDRDGWRLKPYGWIAGVWDCNDESTCRCHDDATYAAGAVSNNQCTAGGQSTGWRRQS